jgi:hypothetical protein
MGFENITKEGNFYQSVIGDYGFKLISAGASSSESFRAIQLLEDSVVTTTTTVGDALTSASLLAGTTIFGKFDTVSVASGSVIAYKAS